MKSTWINGIIIVVVIGIVIIALHYRESNKDVPLNEIFPEEHTYPVDVEFVDEQASDVSTSNQNVKPVKKAIESQKISLAEKPIQNIQASSKPATASAAAVKTSKPVPDTVSQVMGKSGAFTIQVVSSKDKAKAEELVKKLKSKNYDAFLLSAEVKDKGTWYRVYVGRFASKNQAVQYVSNLKSEYPAAFVMEFKN